MSDVFIIYYPLMNGVYFLLMNDVCRRLLMNSVFCVLQQFQVVKQLQQSGMCMLLSVDEWCGCHRLFMNSVFVIVDEQCFSLSVHEWCVCHCLFMNGVFGIVRS